MYMQSLKKHIHTPFKLTSLISEAVELCEEEVTYTNIDNHLQT